MDTMKRNIQYTLPKTIAETAFTHEGDINYLKKMIKLAADKGFDCVKFQIILDVEAVYDKSSSNYLNIKNRAFNELEWLEILNYAYDHKLDIISLPIDYEAVKFIAKNNNLLDALEIHSIALNDVKFLELINQEIEPNLDIILGIGGRNTSDINFCINKLVHNNLILMYGMQNFPTHKYNNSLLKISNLSKIYSYPIGFADHTSYDEMDKDLILSAVLLGATYIEKHIILKAGDNRSDYHSAIDSEGIDYLFHNLQHIKHLLGAGDVDMLNLNEVQYRERERKIVANRDLYTGDVIKTNDLLYKCTAQITDIEPKFLDCLISRKIVKPIAQGEVFRLEHVI